MDRTSQIEERLTQHFRDIGAQAVALSATDWPFHDPDPDDSRRMLGITSPRPVPGRGWVAAFSPEVIDQVTKDLGDEDFDRTLMAMEWIMDVEVEHVQTLSTVERIAAADRALAEIASGSLRYLSEAQLRALDAQQ